MTTTRNLIRASAEITHITTLRVGDVYKRLDTSSSDRLFVGIVTDVLHNGEEAAIVAVEYGDDWSGVQVSRKVYATDRDLAIFPCTAEEFASRMGDLVPTARRKVRDAERDLAKAQETLAEVERVASLTPTTPEFTDSVPAPAEAVTTSQSSDALDF